MSGANHALGVHPAFLNGTFGDQDIIDRQRCDARVVRWDPVNLSGDALMAELRDQRARDLYLGGFRLGDLRRWKDNGVGDFFPTGDHVTDGPAGGQYGDATYYPLPSSEYEGNPNIRRGG